MALTIPARTVHPAGSGHRLGPDELEAIARGLAGTAPEFVLDEHDEHREYARVLSTPLYDAWIIRWSPSALLELHDHGGSTGVVHLVEGELVELRTDLVDPEPSPRPRLVRAGTTIVIAPSTVHGVTNMAPEDALSVHVYSPPMSTMTFYESVGGAVVPTRSTAEQLP